MLDKGQISNIIQSSDIWGLDAFFLIFSDNYDLRSLNVIQGQKFRKMVNLRQILNNIINSKIIGQNLSFEVLKKIMFRGHWRSFWVKNFGNGLIKSNFKQYQKELNSTFKWTIRRFFWIIQGHQRSKIVW